MGVQKPDLEAPFLEARTEAARKRSELEGLCSRILLGVALVMGGAVALERCPSEPTSTAEVFDWTPLPPSHK